MTTHATSDVFLSYKAEDRARLKPLVAALEAEGFGVWWDAHIGGGTNWRQDIQDHLDHAKCVIVAWTKRSVGPQGNFVHDEATRAQRRGVYLPVRLDAVEPPLGFGEVQALSLKGWKGDRADPRFQAVADAVRGRIAGEHIGPRRTHVAEGRVSRRAVIAGGAGAVALAGAGGWMLLKPAPANAKRIAVLPFANLSGDEKQAYFSEGIAEELRAALSRIQLEVIGRSSSEAVKSLDTKAAAAKLGVANILTGSVRRSPEMIRINAQLVSGSDGVERWAESYDRAPGDAIKIQSDIAKNVAEALSVTLGQAVRTALTLGGTDNAAAHDLYLKAMALNSTETGEANVRRVLALLDGAIELDPKYADAYAAKATLHVVLTSYFAIGDESGYAQGEAAARRALELAPGLPGAYFALGELALARFDARTALAMFRRAATPGKTRRYAALLADLGRTAEASVLVEQAVALDPLNPDNDGFRAYLFFLAHRYAKAIEASRRLLKVAPKRFEASLLIGNCLLLLGRPIEALQEYAHLPDEFVGRLVGESIAAAKLGDRAQSDQKFKTLVEGYGDAMSYQQAEIHAQRGEPDKAFAALDRAFQVRDPGLMMIRADPFLDPLRSDSRLAAIERRLKLP